LGIGGHLISINIPPKKEATRVFAYYFGMVGIRYFLLLNSRHKIPPTLGHCDLGTMFFFAIL
jgi:hypothetical protein